MYGPDRKGYQMTVQHGWLGITVEFLHSTDAKTVGHVFETLRGLNVRVKVKGRPYQDMRVVSVLEHRGDDSGLLLSPIGPDGEPTDARQKFVGYEVIESIGVY